MEGLGIILTGKGCSSSSWEVKFLKLHLQFDYLCQL